MSGDRRRSAGRDLPIDLSLNLSPVAYDAAAFEPSAVMGSAAEELMVRRLSAGGRRIRTCMGLFLSSRVFGLLSVLCSEVCPGKASMFSRRQSCRGKSQSSVVRIAEEMETEPSKPIDKISRGEITSHRAVSKENALWPRKK